MDVKAWLEDLQCGAYAEAFDENGIDFALLSELSNDDLKDLGVARLTASACWQLSRPSRRSLAPTDLIPPQR